MACMCGDSCCPSCGPAQGNSRCPLCQAWFSDGCVHVNEETGLLNPEFEAEADELAEAEAEAEAEEARRQDEAERLWNSQE